MPQSGGKQQMEDAILKHLEQTGTNEGADVGLPKEQAKKGELNPQGNEQTPETASGQHTDAPKNTGDGNGREGGEETTQTQTKSEGQPEPEFTLPDGRKVKLSQIKEWELGHLRQSDYTKKTQELAAEKKEIEQLRNLADYLKANPKKLQKIVGILESKEQEAEQEAESNELEGLDKDDPYVKVMTKGQQMMLKQIQELKAEIEAEKKEKQTREIQKLIDDEMESAFSKLEFANDDEKKAVKQLTLSDLKDNPANYATEESFLAAIREKATTYHGLLSRVGEARVKRYLDTKKTPVPVSSQTTNKASPKVKGLSIATLQEDIEAMLSEAEEKK